MALDRENAALDVTGALINNIIRKQRWYQANSNTVTTIAGFVATVVAWAATQPWVADPRVEVAITLIGFLLTVFGVKFTKNGFSKSQVAKIAQANAEYVAEHPLIPKSETHDPLEARVAEYNASRE